MEITAVDAIPVAVDVKPLGEGWGVAPYVGSGGVTESTRRLLVRLETDAGVVGWGETVLEPSPRAASAIVEDAVEPALVGRRLPSMTGLDDAIGAWHLDLGAVRGGVEMAMWDALGTHLGVPVSTLLGGRTADAVPVAFCLGILDPDESAEHARRALAAGFGVLKTKAGRDWREDVERAVAMHEATDGRLDLRLDPNQAWSFGDAVRVGAALEDAGVYLQYLEQPTRIDAPGTYARLRERLRQPVGVNEDTYESHNLYQLVAADAIDAAVIDLVNAGGLLGARRLAGVAAEAGISLAHHSSFDLGIKTAAVLQLVASTPALDLPPDRVNYALADDVIDPRIELADGAMRVPDGPGLGVTVDEDAVEAHRLD